MRLLVAALIALVVFPSAVLAQCTFFLDKLEFERFNEEHGKFLKGVEDFEESNIPPMGKQALPAPLEGNVPNVAGPKGIGFPNGLEQKNIIIQDNVHPVQPNAPDTATSGSPIALYVIGPGFIGSNSEKVGEDLFLEGRHASLDLLFTEPNHTGIGFLLSRFEGFPNGGWHITVFDKSNHVLGKFQVEPPLAPEPDKSFFGTWCESSIGRINIFDKAGAAPDAIDEIQMWEELVIPVEPVSWGTLKATYLD